VFLVVKRNIRVDPAQWSVWRKGRERKERKRNGRERGIGESENWQQQQQ
jgi:hypothetical protein